VELDEDTVVVTAAVAPDAGRDKAPDEWAARPPGRAATAFARRVGIANRTLSGCPAPAGLAPSAARR